MTRGDVTSDRQVGEVGFFVWEGVAVGVERQAVLQRTTPPSGQRPNGGEGVAAADPRPSYRYHGAYWFALPA